MPTALAPWRHSLIGWRHRFIAADPGHVRLQNALTITLGIVLAASASWLIVAALDAPASLLAMGTFLGMMTGLSVRDGTGRDRVVTTALLIVPVITSLTVATLLSPWRSLEVAAFIALGGFAVWIRQFGPRLTALGMVAFFAYFFGLLLRPTIAELPYFYLVGAAVVMAMTAVRVAAIRDRPLHTVEVLLAGLRSTSSAALSIAAARPHVPGVSRAEHVTLRRVDEIARAISDWQGAWSTETVLDTDPVEFAQLVLDARVGLEHTCLEITEQLDAGHAMPPAIISLIDDFQQVLHGSTTARKLEDLGARISAASQALPPGEPFTLTGRLLGSTAASHIALRRIELHRTELDRNGLDRIGLNRIGAKLPKPGRKRDPSLAPPARPATTPAPVHAPTMPGQAAGLPKPAPPVDPPVDPPAHWWLRWSAVSRMTLQVVVATALATVVGELISASRWYWAVLTSFLVFVGATTRGATLTRASRRITGTFTGLIIGFGVAVALRDHPALLAVVLAGCVFGALYFGPLRYSYQSFFMTVMLASLYGLLGILDWRLLALRLEETIAGALIGVACAYLIFSGSSRPAITAKANAYYDALGDLLEACRVALSTPGQTGAADVIAAMGRLDTAHAQVATTVETLSAVFLNGRHHLAAEITHMMGFTSLYAGRLAQAITEEAAAPAHPGPAERDAFDAAFAHVRHSSELSRAALVDGEFGGVDVHETTVLDLLSGLPYADHAPRMTVRYSLSRINWALLRTVQLRRDA